MEEELQTARRRMLRLMFVKRRMQQQEPSADLSDGSSVLEPWVDYVRRATHLAEGIMNKFGSECWAPLQRRRKWRFAGRVARNPDKRWTKRLLYWKPTLGGGRSVGRPVTRWTDDLEQYAGGKWMDHAMDPRLWRLLEDGFVHRFGT